MIRIPNKSFTNANGLQYLEVRKKYYHCIICTRMPSVVDPDVILVFTRAFNWQAGRFQL